MDTRKTSMLYLQIVENKHQFLKSCNFWISCSSQSLPFASFTNTLNFTISTFKIICLLCVFVYVFVYRYRLRNKKISATVRTFPLLNKVGVNSTVSTTTGNVISVIGSPEATGKMVPSTNGIANLESGVPQLIPRCADTSLRALENTKKGGKTGANGQNVSGSPTESLPEK